MWQTRRTTRVRRGRTQPSWHHAMAGRKHRSRKSLQGILLFALAFITVGGVAGLRSAGAHDRDLDDALCRRDAPLPAHVVFLFDPTDRHSAGQYRTMETEIVKRAAALARGGRLSVFALVTDTAGSFPRLLFSRCNPGDGSNTPAWRGNPHLAARRYREEFDAPLHRSIDSLRAMASSATSPLLEALYRIIPAAFPSTIGLRVLVMFSDLLENSDLLSHYKTGYHFSDVERSVYVQDVKDALAGVQVVIYKLTGEQSASYHTPEHTQFWANYLMWSGTDRDDQIIKLH